MLGRKIISRVEQVVADELKKIAVKFVCAGLRYRAHGCGPAALRRQSARFHLEFLRRIGEGHRHIHAAEKVQVAGAIQRKVRAIAHAARDRENRAVAAQSIRGDRLLHSAASKSDQVLNVTAVEWQF